jgi:hypothetical protein
MASFVRCSSISASAEMSAHGTAASKAYGFAAEVEGRTVKDCQGALDSIVSTSNGDVEATLSCREREVPATARYYQLQDKVSQHPFVEIILPTSSQCSDLATATTPRDDVTVSCSSISAAANLSYSAVLKAKALGRVITLRADSEARCNSGLAAMPAVIGAIDVMLVCKQM